MSAPNKSYDPKTAASLAPGEVARVLDEALAAIAAAGTLDELKAARIAHEGDRAPLSLASAEIGALPPEARAEAGRRVGAARGQLREKLRERQARLEAERDRQVLVTEAVDVTLPWDQLPPGARHPVNTLDATHSPVFHQIEGLAVDEGLTMADLRGAIQSFVDAMFGSGLRTRLRPDYFPFTEPSGDVSMECHICRGASAKPGGEPCRVCRSQGWIEIAGCGMVNPRVLVACGIDPDRYSGFAFGLGIERSLMIAHGLTEIRDAVEGDVRFSRAFGMEI